MVTAPDIPGHSGLAAAHLAGVLHRDIKPANILVNRYGIVGLSDFGLASIIAAGGEQNRVPRRAHPGVLRAGELPGRGADGRRRHLLPRGHPVRAAGRPPRFAADGKTPSLATIVSLHDKPVDDVPGTPPEFMALLRRTLSPDPAARPQTAAAFRDALIGLDAGAPLAAPQAPHTGPVYPGDPTTDPSGSRPEAFGTGPPAAAPGTGAGLGRHAAWGPAPARRRPATLLVGAAAALVILVAAVIIGVCLLPHHTAPGTGGTAADRQNSSPESGPAPVGAFGVATVRIGCPAASLHLAAARCPAYPECFAGLVEISGVVSAAPLPCSEPHYWETFAIAIMPAGARTFDQPILAENPTVKAVCSMRVLLASRRITAQRIPVSSWQIEVLPPTEAAFDSGTRTFRCVANVVGTQPATSQFRR